MFVLGVAVDGCIAGAAGGVAVGMLGVAEGELAGFAAAGAPLPAAALLFALLLGEADALEAADVGGTAEAPGCDDDAGLLGVIGSAFGFELPPQPIATTRHRPDTVNVDLLDMSHLEVSLG